MFKGCLDADGDGTCAAGDPTGTLRFSFIYWATFDPKTDALVRGDCVHPVTGGTGGFAKAKGVIHMIDTPAGSGVKTTYTGSLLLPGVAPAAVGSGGETPPAGRSFERDAPAAAEPRCSVSPGCGDFRLPHPARAVEQPEQGGCDLAWRRWAAGDAEVDREHVLHRADDLGRSSRGRPLPSAQSPSATTRRGSGIASYAVRSAARMRVVTGPVTSRTSAWRGEATIPRPYRAMSTTGLETSVSSCSQPLHEPQSTWRIASEPGARGRRKPDRAAELPEVAKERQHQPVHAGVAELEALVDEREVGKQVARRGVGDRRPVRVRAGAEADAADSIAVSLDDARRRSARALDAPDADRRLDAIPSALPQRANGAVEQAVEDVEARKQLERALLEPGLHVAGRTAKYRRLEAVVGEARARRADILGDARRARGGADDTERRSPSRRRRCRCRASDP